MIVTRPPATILAPQHSVLKMQIQTQHISDETSYRQYDNNHTISNTTMTYLKETQKQFRYMTNVLNKQKARIPKHVHRTYRHLCMYGVKTPLLTQSKTPILTQCKTPILTQCKTPILTQCTLFIYKTAHYPTFHITSKESTQTESL